MPRIDPLQLLKCLAVLLNPDGGILSRDEVPRLVNLMTKFSKKLVSKCVYVLILKHTETSLVDMFMAEGGWALIQNWLQDAAQGGNWNLVQEILELLLITPVDVERLKSNGLPMLIKNLSKRKDLGEVTQLSVQIVQYWLTIVKSTHTPSSAGTQQPNNQKSTENNQLDSSEQQQQQQREEINKNIESSDFPENIENNLNTDQSISTTTFYKIALKDGKQIIKKLNPGETPKQINNNRTSIEDEINKKITDYNSKNSSDSNNSSKFNGDNIRSKLSFSSSSKNKSSSSSSRRDNKDRKSSQNSSSRSKSSSRDKDRKDRDRDRDKKDRKKRSSSRSSSKSDTNKDNNTRSDSNPKEKQSERDKDTLEKIKPQTLDKLGRIPKKAANSSGSVEVLDKQKENQPKENLPEKKKPSFSILNRKATGEERTKTVKVFNSKMRSTGLEEEAKPPPPRSAKKSSTVSSSLAETVVGSVSAKRLSPSKEHSNNNLAPPEKKLKIDKLDIGLSLSLGSDRPGAIKLIPPKAKPAILQESDMFMDALTASAPKKEAKKRKRRTSLTKDVAINETTPSAPVSPSSTVNSGASTATFGFYQDTINEMSTKNDVESISRTEDAADEEQNADSNDSSAATPTDQDASLLEDEETSSSSIKQSKLIDGKLKGVLVYTKKKGPKKSIKWKSDEDLVEIKFFELDETERVNVTKTFNDMAKMELSSEREAFIMSRKLPNEDTMEPQTAWRMPFIVDQPAIAVIHGSKSIEKDIQLAREKTSLPALYFDKRRIPDNPEEAILENHQISDPVIIPLEDPGGQEIDLRNTQWPEPKGSIPTSIENTSHHQLPSTLFPNIPPFNSNNFNNISSSLPSGHVVPTSFVVPPNFSSIPPNLGPPPHHHHHPGSFTQNLMPNLNNLIGVVPPHQLINNQTDLLNSSGFNNNVPPGTDPLLFMNSNNGTNTDPNFPFNNNNNNARTPNMLFNNFNNNHRGGAVNNNNNNNRGGFRRGATNSGPGGWVQMNGQRINNNNLNNNWNNNNNKRGGSVNNINGVRGGRICKNIQNHGYCRNRDNCPFVH